MADVPAQFDPATRAFKVRLEVDNPENLLRPDMFVDVEFLVVLQPAVVIPADAVLDSGMRKTVFVDLGKGFFEPRAVKTGWRFDGKVEIPEGLMPGERIVISGNFLIDSESRMKLAAAGLYGTPGKDPVCGMEVYPSKAKPAGLVSDFDGKTYYFCSQKCKTEFGEHHGNQMQMPSTGPMQHSVSYDQKADVPGTIAKDPVCSMAVRQDKAKAAGLTSDYGNRTYHFCCRQCKEKFDRAPERYSGKIPGNMAHRGAPEDGEHTHD